MKRVLNVVLFAWLLSLPLSAVEVAAQAPATGPVGLDAATAADTVRTNLWLVEALLGEVMSAAAEVLPAGPARVRVIQQGSDPRDEVGLLAATRALGGAGHELYTAVNDTAGVAPVDYNFAFRVPEVSLQYPEVGRTLGLWRRWVDRVVSVAATVEITEAATGRILLNERLERGFRDRVDDDVFAVVESTTYPFTAAEPEGGGWQDRMEEIVVLGTVAGLVAVYFANTGE